MIGLLGGCILFLTVMVAYCAVKLHKLTQIVDESFDEWGEWSNCIDEDLDAIIGMIEDLNPSPPYVGDLDKYDIYEPVDEGCKQRPDKTQVAATTMVEFVTLQCNICHNEWVKRPLSHGVYDDEFCPSCYATDARLVTPQELEARSQE